MPRFAACKVSCIATLIAFTQVFCSLIAYNYVYIYKFYFYNYSLPTPFFSVDTVAFYSNSKYFPLPTLQPNKLSAILSSYHV